MYWNGTHLVNITLKSPVVERRTLLSQGSQIRQIWRILRQNCSDDSAEFTEGVTSTPEIFGNKQVATLTPEILVRSTVLSLSFSQQIQFTLVVNVANLN